MRTISWVAVSVFRESVRDRVPYNLVLFAILLIGSSFLLGQLTAGQDVKIIKDLGLAEEGVGYALDEYNQALIPEEVKARLEELKQAIINGEIQVPETR